MNSGDREFSDMITFCEKELTALKTSHMHPLGSLNFYTKRESITVNLSESYGVYAVMFWLDVKIETPTVTPPITQVGWDVPAGFVDIDLFEYTVDASYSTYSYRMFLQSPTQTSATFAVSALSSMPVQSISARVI